MNEEAAKVLGATTSGTVRDYSPQEMIAHTSFKSLPKPILDFHLGKLLFAHTYGQFKAIELRQYQPMQQQNFAKQVGHNFF